MLLDMYGDQSAINSLRQRQSKTCSSKETFTLRLSQDPGKAACCHQPITVHAYNGHHFIRYVACESMRELVASFPSQDDAVAY